MESGLEPRVHSSRSHIFTTFTPFLGSRREGSGALLTEGRSLRIQEPCSEHLFLTTKSGGRACPFSPGGSQPASSAALAFCVQPGSQSGTGAPCRPFQASSDFLTASFSAARLGTGQWSCGLTSCPGPSLTVGRGNMAGAMLGCGCAGFGGWFSGTLPVQVLGSVLPILF